MAHKDFHIRIPNEVHLKLKFIAKERGIAQKWLMVSAIEEYLNGDKESNVEELKKELFEIKRRLKALREDMEILGELLSFFIYHWLGYTPKLEKAERASLAVEARERHERFMAMFVRKLTVGDLSLAPILARGVNSEEKQSEKVKEEED